ncbi:uncharacterized protein LOC135376045 isoform X2 [Ornithodoros turicata]|uniref:uncharacterized protein LOC135376045 isoform X2 n=1 Tax=Ornithodoros turicata TaxID=34597 RepID=UPI003138D114
MISSINLLVCVMLYAGMATTANTKSNVLRKPPSPPGPAKKDIGIIDWIIGRVPEDKEDAVTADKYGVARKIEAFCKKKEMYFPHKERASTDQRDVTLLLHPYHQEVLKLAAKQRRAICRIRSSLKHMRQVISQSGSRYRVFLSTILTFIEAKIRLPNMGRCGSSAYEMAEDLAARINTERSQIKARWDPLSWLPTVPSITLPSIPVPSIPEVISQIGNKIVNKTNEVGQEIETTAKETGQKIEQGGETLLKNFAKGMQAVAEEMEKNFASVYEKASQAVKDEFNSLKQNIVAHLPNLNMISDALLLNLTLEFYTREGQLLTKEVSYYIELAVMAARFIQGYYVGYTSQNYSLCTAVDHICDYTESTMRSGMQVAMEKAVDGVHLAQALLAGKTTGTPAQNLVCLALIAFDIGMALYSTPVDAGQGVLEDISQVAGEIAGAYLAWFISAESVGSGLRQLVCL